MEEGRGVGSLDNNSRSSSTNHATILDTQEDKGGEQVYPSEDPSEVDGGVGGNATLRSRLECIKRTDRYPKGKKVKQTRKVIQEVSCDINFTFLSHYYYSVA